MGSFIRKYSLILGSSSDKPLESGVSTFTEVIGAVPFIPAEDRNGGLTTVPGWRLAGDAPLTFYPGISKEGESVDGQPSTTPAASAYYKKAVLRTFVHPDLQGTVVSVNYSSDGSDTETGRFFSVYQELWGSQVESNAGSVANQSFGTVY